MIERTQDVIYLGSATPAQGGGGGGSSDYNDLSNKPKINGVTLQGNKTNIDLGISKIVDVGTAQETYKTYVLPKISVEDALEAYNSFVSGTHTVLLWTLYDNPTYLNIISTDEIAGTCSIDVCLRNQFHISYKWDSDTEDFCTYEVNENEYTNLADTSLSNLTDEGKITVAHLAMPSSVYDSLTPPSSGGGDRTKYTAPSDGFFVINYDITYGGIGAAIVNESKGEIGTYQINSNSASFYTGWCPAEKGDTIGVWLTASTPSVNWLRFYYAIGSESEKQGA